MSIQRAKDLFFTKKNGSVATHLVELGEGFGAARAPFVPKVDHQWTIGATSST